ncbi:hypothetical protein [Jiella pelagia]|uniref:Uncharacterized protein n=1 Tax=Jiella pelagia TaxID=2986949 RepID=A0ABY7BZZ5_9HYPH|nr:hypothetical protein [Jiella pelagia]WAP69057.1 hypothetical protein OH818_01600 [Jiella pelagia]
MGKPIVVCLYDLTGVGVEPWIEAGCEAVLVDIQHPVGETREGSIIKIGADIHKGWTIPTWVKKRAVFAMCWTPCDNTAVSGARWFKGKGLRKLAWSIDCCATGAEVINELDVPGFIENPVSTLATYWRKPDYKFHPHHYTGYAANDNYTKQTCVWAFGDFRMPTSNPLLGLGGS